MWFFIYVWPCRGLVSCPGSNPAFHLRTAVMRSSRPKVGRGGLDSGWRTVADWDVFEKASSCSCSNLCLKQYFFTFYKAAQIFHACSQQKPDSNFLPVAINHGGDVAVTATTVHCKPANTTQLCPSWTNAFAESLVVIMPQ